MGSLELENTDDWYENKEADCLKELQLKIQGNKDFEDFTEFLDDKFLLHFVRGKKYDSKKAFETLERYIYLRTTKHNAFFKSLSASNIGMNNGLLGVLKKRDHLQRLIVIDRARMWDPRKVSMDDAFKLFILVLEEIWNTKEAEIHGTVVIFDMANWNFEQIKALSPRDVIRGYNLFGENIPMRYKAFHIVNEVYLFSIVLKVVRPIFPKKIRDRIHVHSTYLESLHEHVSRDVLPKSLGGIIPDETAFDEEFEQRIRDKEEYYRRFAEKL